MHSSPTTSNGDVFVRHIYVNGCMIAKARRVWPDDWVVKIQDKTLQFSDEEFEKFFTVTPASITAVTPMEGDTFSTSANFSQPSTLSVAGDPHVAHFCRDKTLDSTIRSHDNSSCNNVKNTEQKMQESKEKEVDSHSNIDENTLNVLSAKNDKSEYYLNSQRWKALENYLIGDRTDLDDAIVACTTADELSRVIDNDTKKQR